MKDPETKELALEVMNTLQLHRRIAVLKVKQQSHTEQKSDETQTEQQSDSKQIDEAQQSQSNTQSKAQSESHSQSENQLENRRWARKLILAPGESVRSTLTLTDDELGENGITVAPSINYRPADHRSCKGKVCFSINSVDVAQDVIRLWFVFLFVFFFF